MQISLFLKKSVRVKDKSGGNIRFKYKINSLAAGETFTFYLDAMAFSNTSFRIKA